MIDKEKEIVYIDYFLPIHSGAIVGIRDPMNGRFLAGHPKIGGKPKGYVSMRMLIAQMLARAPMEGMTSNADELVFKIFEMAFKGNEQMIKLIMASQEGNLATPIEFPKEFQAIAQKFQEIDERLEKIFGPAEGPTKPRKIVRFTEAKIVEKPPVIPKAEEKKDDKREQPKHPRVGTVIIPDGDGF